MPTQEVLAAAQLLRRHLPQLAVRVVNVVDMTRLLPREEHPHGMSDFEYEGLFTTDKPVIFAYHGYPWLIHRLAYRRTGHKNLHVRGYKESGTTTTPFDMVVRNDLDRYRLVMDVIDRVPGLAVRAAAMQPADGRRPHPPPCLDPRTRHRPARGRRLDLEHLRTPAGAEEGTGRWDRPRLPQRDGCRGRCRPHRVVDRPGTTATVHEASWRRTPAVSPHRVPGRVPTTTGAAPAEWWSRA